MKVLVVGGGGREHALAWKCAQSKKVTEVIVAPGNAGTALEPKLRNVAVDAENIEDLLDLAVSETVGLTIIGPEMPLVAGVVDRFREHGLACFGPTAEAAQLEGSKVFTKDFLKRHNIPTATSESFTDLESAFDYIREQGAPIVVKADGLAAGKGVIVARTIEEAEQAVIDMLDTGRFGEAGDRIVIEEFLDGEEASFIVMTDGETILPLATSQDHKARDEGDTGPNTGGMGAYSPAPVVTPELDKRIMTEVIQPTLDGLIADGIRYLGFLYAGLMITSDGTPKVLEFNCRFGDPETQPIMTRLHSDLVELCESAIEGRLAGKSIDWDPRVALGVVMASHGYPSNYRKGDRITGLSDLTNDSVKIFHGGTALDGGDVVTNGGRVLCVVGMGNSVVAARDVAYAQVECIRWNDHFFRRDIGHRAIARNK